MYNLLIRPFVRFMNDNTASRVALKYFLILGKIPGARMFSRLFHNNRPSGLEREVFGLQFYNPVGLGAGLDCNGELYNDLNDLGFSYVEIGPLNSSNVRRAIEHIKKDPQNDILAACIDGDYQLSFSLSYDFCDFFVLEMPLNLDTALLRPILDIRLTYGEYKPIVVKIPESVEDESELFRFLDFCRLNGIDGIEVRSLRQVQMINGMTKGRFPIIANCHINSPLQAWEMLKAGASLIEVRMGLVRQGPGLIGSILKYLEDRHGNEGE